MSILSRNETMIYVKIFHNAEKADWIDEIIDFTKKEMVKEHKMFFEFFGNKVHLHSFIDIPESTKSPDIKALKQEFKQILVMLPSDSICVLCEEVCLIENPGKCTICLEEFRKEEECIRLKCGHMLHVPCAYRWLSDNNTCPMCRANQMEKITVVPTEQRVSVDATDRGESSASLDSDSSGSEFGPSLLGSEWDWRETGPGTGFSNV